MKPPAIGDAPNFLRRVDLDSLQRNKLSVISLFSGAGGMDCGMRMAGLEIRVMIDSDHACCQTLRINFTRAGWRAGGFHEAQPRYLLQKREPVILERDICQTTTQEILAAADLQVGEAGVVTGGFPCQGFSTSGKRVVEDPRNSLYLQCVRVVKEALPRFFVFENVRGLVSMAKGRIIDRICRDLADCGYDVRWQLLDAADYGVPQHRVRVFFIGERRDIAVLPASGRMRLHIGCAPGRYKHPEFFEKRYRIASTWSLDGTLPNSTSANFFSGNSDEDRATIPAMKKKNSKKATKVKARSKPTPKLKGKAAPKLHSKKRAAAVPKASRHQKKAPVALAKKKSPASTPKLAKKRSAVAGQYDHCIFTRLGSDDRKEMIRKVAESTGASMAEYVAHFAAEAARAGMAMPVVEKGPVAVGKKEKTTEIGSRILAAFDSKEVKQSVMKAAKAAKVSASSYIAHFAVEAAKAGKKVPQTAKAETAEAVAS
jgi:DNA (cytosine-5)-methyltransferase 1